MDAPSDAPSVAPPTQLSPLDEWWWGGYDTRRIWAPRFSAASWSRETAGRVFLVWRCFTALYCLCVSSADVAIADDKSFYLAYLTTQSLWLVTAFFTCAAVAAITIRLSPSLACGSAMPPLVWRAGAPSSTIAAAELAWAGLLRATQLLASIAVPFQLVVVTLYWLLLATPKPTMLSAWDNIESHGIKFALIWADLLVSPMRLPDRHVLLTAVAVVVYLVINLGVSLNERPVYGILTWRTSGSAPIVIGAAIFAIVSFFLAAAIAAARDRSMKSEVTTAPGAPPAAP